MSAAVAENPADSAGVEDRARALSTVILNIGGIYGDTVAHNLQDIVSAFGKSLEEIALYCEANSIQITSIDTVKLFCFALPHLKQANPSANVGRYLTACMLFLLGRSHGELPEHIRESARVYEKMARSNEAGSHLQVYSYMKGMQETFDIIDQGGDLVD